MTSSTSQKRRSVPTGLLGKLRSWLGDDLPALFKRPDPEALEELETRLLLADVGVEVPAATFGSPTDAVRDLLRSRR